MKKDEKRNGQHNSKSDHHVIVVSYDAFSADNWEMARKQPHLAALIKNGAYSTQLKSVHPTLTYVIHSTFVTGVYPDKHGIFHNNPLQPFVDPEDQEWFWFREQIKAPTIYDVLYSHGLTSAALLWPVTGKARITYNIPEIRAIRQENQALKILKNGSPLFSLGMELKYGKTRRGIEQPELDDFTAKCAVDTIKRKKPNLLMLHWIDLDDAKHTLGTKGPHIAQVVKRMDDRLGLLIKAVEEAGLQEKTTIIVVGDHGQKDVRYAVHLNRLLYERGLIYEEQGELRWRAYIQGAGGSAYVHMKEGDHEAEEQVRQLLQDALDQGKYGIERLYTKEDLESYRAADKACYMLEACEGYCFEDGHEPPIVVDLQAAGKVYATHGYAPDKPNYTSVMVLSGNKIKSDHPFGSLEAVDLAPTIARLLDVPFGPCDGSVLEEVLVD